MFDIGLGELLVLGLLALLVFGPDRLPSAASSAGKFVARAKETLGQAKSQISSSVEVDSMTEDLRSLAELHPKRMLASLAETEPASPAQPKAAAPKPVPPASGPPVDPNAT